MEKESKAKTFKSIRIATEVLIELREIQHQKKADINFDRHITISDIIEEMLEKCYPKK